MKLQTKLKNWSEAVLKVVTDEELKDIDLVIKYHDHGDEFLYVRTYSGEEYKYGYWLDRNNCWADFDPDLNGKEDLKHGFIRRPYLNKKPDHRSELSNKIFFTIHDKYTGIVREDTWFERAREITDPAGTLDYVLSEIKAVLETNTDVMYDFNNNSYKRDIMYYIEKHDLGEEYIKKVEEIPWSSKIDGIDGIAGKRKADNYLYGDGVREVLYRGRDFDIDKLSYSHGDIDDWGYVTYVLNTKQFA